MLVAPFSEFTLGSYLDIGPTVPEFGLVR